MPYSISHFDQVRIDVRDARAWYKKQQPGLEKRFSDSFKTAIAKLRENPLAYGVRYKNIRVAYLKIFPYGIHFYMDDVRNQIVIVAIVHNKQNPEVAQGRV